jgi:hypothetical protein
MHKADDSTAVAMIDRDCAGEAGCVVHVIAEARLLVTSCFVMCHFGSITSGLKVIRVTSTIGIASWAPV